MKLVRHHRRSVAALLLLTVGLAAGACGGEPRNGERASATSAPLSEQDVSTAAVPSGSPLGIEPADPAGDPSCHGPCEGAAETPTPDYLPVDPYEPPPGHRAPDWDHIYEEANITRYDSLADAVEHAGVRTDLVVPEGIPGKLKGVYVENGIPGIVQLVYTSDEYQTIVVTEQAGGLDDETIKLYATPEYCPLCAKPPRLITLAGGQSAAARESTKWDPTAVIWRQNGLTMYVQGPGGGKFPLDVAIDIANRLSTHG